MLYCA